MTTPEDQRTVIARIIERHGELRAVETADYAEIFDAHGEKVALTTRPDLILLLNTLAASLPQTGAMLPVDERASHLHNLARKIDRTARPSNIWTRETMSDEPWTITPEIQTGLSVNARGSLIPTDQLRELVRRVTKADAILASLPQGPPASTSELGRIEPIPAIALLRTFSFPAYPQLFQSTDGGCTEVLIEDADVQKVRDFLKFSSEPDQQPADDSEGRAAAEEKPSDLPQARAMGAAPPPLLIDQIKGLRAFVEDTDAELARAVGDEEVERALEAYQRIMFAHALNVTVTGEAMTGKEAKLAEAVFKGRQKAAMRAALATLPPAPDQAPIPMVLHCPACGLQHIDAPEADADIKIFTAGIDGQPMPWTNPPHRSHFCHGCGYIWRPADVPTDGVAAIPTRGKVDSPLPPAPGWRGMELLKRLSDAADEVNGTIDAQTYDEKYRASYDAPTYTVEISAEMIRDLNAAICDAQAFLDTLPSPPGPSEEVG